MRLSGILSKEPSKKYYQVEGFFEKALKYGEQKRNRCRNSYIIFLL